MDLAAAILAKTPLPTRLDTADFRMVFGKGIRARAFFSARTTEQKYLQEIQQIIADFAAGKINKAKAREMMLRWLDHLGYDPKTGFPSAPGMVPRAEPDSLRDLSSMMRLNLIAETQKELVASAARIAAETPVSVMLYPAWRLERYDMVTKPRGTWELRWRAAGDAVDWEGACRSEMVALKNSPIWQALGDGAGDYFDTLGNPYPPFAFNSGMSWTPVDAEEGASLGLDVSEASVPEASPAPSSKEIALALKAMPPESRETFMKQLKAEKLSLNKAQQCPDDGRFLDKEGNCTNCRGSADDNAPAADQPPKKIPGTDHPMIGHKGDWKSAGFKSGAEMPTDTAAKTITAKEGISRLRKGESVKSPLGDTLHFDDVTRKHLYQGRDRGKAAERLRELDQVRAAIENPHEIWQSPKSGRRSYVHFTTDTKGRRVLNAVDEAGGHVYAWHSSASSFDHWRKGGLLYVRPS